MKTEKYRIFCLLLSSLTCVMFIVADKIWLYVDDVMFLFVDRSQISLDETPQPVTVQFVSNGVCFLCVVHVLVDVIDLAYFHSAYFYILLPALLFFFLLQRGWVQRFVKADLRRATFPSPQAVYTKLSPADSIWKAETLVPFITHPGQNCFCPSQWGFGCISNYQKTPCWILKGMGKMRKDVDVRRFRSIQSIHFL